VAGRRGQFGWRYADITGVRSPPLRGGEPRSGGLAGKEPEMAREVVFSEGRGLRARVVRPEAGQGMV